MQIRSIYASLYPTLKNGENFFLDLVSDWPMAQFDDQNPKSLKNSFEL